MPIELKAFLAIPPGHVSLAVRDDAKGNPQVVGTGRLGKVFRVLDRVPLLRSLPPVARYRDDNIRAYALLRTALVNRYGVDDTLRVLERKFKIRAGSALDTQTIKAVTEKLDRSRAKAFCRAYLQLKTLERTYGSGAVAGMREDLIKHKGPITTEWAEKMRAEVEQQYDQSKAAGKQDTQAAPTPALAQPPTPTVATLLPQASSLPVTSSPPPPVEASELASSAALPVTAFHADRTPGLPNLGGTCYANAGLKFVLYAFGRDATTRPAAPEDSLNNAASSGNAIADFIGTLAARADISDQQLRDLFSKLKDAPEFQMFDKGGPYVPHDATDFVEGVVESLKLDSLASHKVRLCRSPEPNQPMETHGEPTCIINASLDGNDKNLDLQAILERKLLASNDAVAVNSQYSIQGLAVDDIAPLRGFALRVTYSSGALATAGARQPTTNIQYDKTVELNITDLEFESSQILVTLAPVAVVMHQGTTDGGHYYMYRKAAAGWERHDDGDVTQVRAIPSNERPVLIGLRVVGRRWMTPTHGPQSVDSDDLNR